MNHEFRLLRRYSAFVAAYVFVLVTTGALVTSTGTGLFVLEWPLSFREWMPPLEGAALHARGHRVLAALAGVLIVILAAATSIPPVPRTTRRLARLAVGIAVVQGFFGGMTVWLRLPVTLSTLHACLGHIFFALTVLIAVLLRDPFPRPLSIPAEEVARLGRLSWMTTGFVFLQLILGSIYRHGGSLLYAHIGGSVLVVLHSVHLRQRLLRLPETWMGTLGNGFLALVAAEIVLGLFSWRMPGVAVTVAHAAVGALLLASSATCSFQLRRRPLALGS